MINSQQARQITVFLSDYLIYLNICQPLHDFINQNGIGYNNKSLAIPKKQMTHHRTPDTRPLLSPSSFYQQISPLNSNLAVSVNPQQQSSQQMNPSTYTSSSPKKSPVKYSYIKSEGQQEYMRANRIFWLQCFATFIFIYTSTCSKEAFGVDLYFFLGIMIAIPICAKQTGANLNPAVSYSMTYKAMDKPLSYRYLLWIYVKAQITGAVIAMLFAIIVNNVYRSPVYPNHIHQTPLLNSSQSPIPTPLPLTLSVALQLILSEAIGIFILIFLILYITGPYSFITSNSAKYIYIAIFVYIGRKFAVSSNNQINIALTLSQAFVGLFQCDFNGFRYLGLWVVGDVVGVVLAGSMYTGVVEPTLEYLEKHENEKVMARLKFWHDTQLKQMADLSKRKEQQMQNQYRDNTDEKIKNKYKDYYKKLSYF